MMDTKENHSDAHGGAAANAKGRSGKQSWGKVHFLYKGTVIEVTTCFSTETGADRGGPGSGEYIPNMERLIAFYFKLCAQKSSLGMKIKYFYRYTKNVVLPSSLH